MGTSTHYRLCTYLDNTRQLCRCDAKPNSGGRRLAHSLQDSGMVAYHHAPAFLTTQPPNLHQRLVCIRVLKLHAQGSKDTRVMPAASGAVSAHSACLHSVDAATIVEVARKLRCRRCLWKGGLHDKGLWRHNTEGCDAKLACSTPALLCLTCASAYSSAAMYERRSRLSATACPYSSAWRHAVRCAATSCSAGGGEAGIVYAYYMRRPAVLPHLRSNRRRCTEALVRKGEPAQRARGKEMERPSVAARSCCNCSSGGRGDNRPESLPRRLCEQQRCKVCIAL